MIEKKCTFSFKSTAWQLISTYDLKWTYVISKSQIDLLDKIYLKKSKTEHVHITIGFYIC